MSIIAPLIHATYQKHFSECILRRLTLGVLLSYLLGTFQSKVIRNVKFRNSMNLHFYPKKNGLIADLDALDNSKTTTLIGCGTQLAATPLDCESLC